MGTLNPALKDLAEALSLTPDEQHQISAAMAESHRLASLAWGATAVYGLGPCARGTASRPVTALPVATVLPAGPLKALVSAAPVDLAGLIAALRDSLAPHLGGLPLTLGDDALYVTFEGRELALVPAFEEGAGHRLPDLSTATFRSCDLGAQVSFTEQVDTSTDGLARPLVRLLHAWRRHQKVKVRPLHLEVMALRSLRRTPESLGAGLLTILQRLPQEIYEPCPDPGDASHKLDHYLKDDAARATIADAAYTAARQITQAIEADRHGEPWAVNIAREVLGPDMPLPPPRRPRPSTFAQDT